MQTLKVVLMLQRLCCATLTNGTNTMTKYSKLMESLRGMEPNVCSCVADAIEDLQVRLAEAEDTNKALRVRLGSELHEPVTTVEDRYNADGWINPNDKTQKQHLPHIGEKVLFCHAGVTYYGKHTGGSFQSFNPPRMFETWGCLWMYPPKAREVRS